MADDNANDEPNGFAVLWAELARRFFSPMRHVSFWVFLTVAVIFFGGLAVWLEVFLYLDANSSLSSDHLKVALTTFSPALVGSVSTQLIFEEAGRNKRIMAFAIFAAFVFSVAGWWLTVETAVQNSLSIPIAALFCVLAVLMWWIANGLNPAFQDSFSSDAPLGGPPTNEPNGDLNGYKT
jgi:hypothetical protein